ncbi:abortive infection system antitoxin AbiGi family protein [Bacteroides sp.]|uniref:abortive infection system antitoxin AbiGi family protein n=1 Tax=Bacteroides sp. TaxID=29523 RepID=UPI002609ED96|nr:abortive infection system antitoxin AbiGi family protein [Bacteroides sp.]
MNTLSANTLFHFTKSKETLINILKSDFRPSYCTEENYLVESKRWKVPMVCFCDIPLSQIEEHAYWYGEYAIGLTKEWAIRNNLNPVLYVNKEVELIDTLKNSFEQLIEKRNSVENFSELQAIINNLLYQYAYIKPYEGIRYDKNQYIDIIKRYYDEREWRYVPKKENEPLFEFATAFFPGQIQELNNSIKDYGLKFEPKHINYIIVSKEQEILEIKREIEKIKGNFPNNDVSLLTTRIISMERIKEDF